VDIKTGHMKIIAIGDIHGNYAYLRDILKSTTADIYLQVGDLAGDCNYYPDLEKRVYFVKGNHECFDILEKYSEPTEIQKNLIYIPNGKIVEINGLRIGALGGNYSPVSFRKSDDELKGKRRAHITKMDFERAMNMKNIDILLTHEAPSPFIKNGRDVGLSLVTSLLFTLKPKFHFFGHHHVDREIEIFDTKSYCVSTFKEVEVDVNELELDANEHG